MNAFTLFRISVVAPLLLSLAGVVYAFFAEATFSQDWKDIFAWNGDGGLIPHSLEDASIGTWIFVLTVGTVALVAFLNQILLFFYWRRSRLIFVITSAFLYPAMLFLGLSILTPVEYVLYELSAFFSGISMALAYYSPVALRFSPSSSMAVESTMATN